MDLESQVISEQTFAKMSDVKIFISSDYDKFKLSKFNREPKHFKKLMKSIQENDYSMYQPILVNHDMEIVDGQGRFLACKELGLPIHFIVSEEIKIYAASEINQASTNWNSNDYVHHYVKRGKESYIRLLSLSIKFGQKISIIASFGKLSNGAKSYSECLRRGDFQFKEGIDIEDFFEHMKIFDEYYHFSKMEKFIKSVLHLYLHPNYKKEIMENKLRQGSRIVKEQPRVELMTAELLNLYNYNNRKPIELGKL